MLILARHVYGQEINKGKLIVEPHAALLFDAGKVNISGTNTPFINTLYPANPADQVNQKDHDGSYLNLGIVLAKQLSPAFRVGLGADVDFYLNIGDYTRYALPVYINLQYTVPSLREHLFIYGNGGYAPGLGSNFRNGAKGEGGLGYSWTGKRSGNRYSFSLGYNYQQLRGVWQYVLTPNEEKNRLFLTQINSVNLNINSFPLKFAIAF